MTTLARRALLAAIATVSVACVAAPARADFDMEIVNDSGRPDGEVYVMLHNGSSSDGKLPNNTPKPLSDIPGRTVTIGNMSATRLFVSYGAAVVPGEPPHSPTRFDKIEFTNPGVVNQTAVDFFGIPIDVETFNSSGASLGTGLSFRCHTDTILPKMHAIAGATGATVTNGGSFVRQLSAQLSPAHYPSMAPYVQSMAGKTLTIDSAFYGTPFQTFTYSGTVQNDGSITLSGSVATPPGSPVPGPDVHISGSNLIEGIYTGDTEFTVGGVPKRVTDAIPQSNVYRDIVAGFTFGYWDSKYGNNSANWNHQPAFAAARAGSSPFSAYNEYAAVIAEYSDAYGYSFHDVGPTAVTAPLDSSVAKMRVTIDSDSGPNVPGCTGSSTNAPSNPSNPPSKRRASITIDSHAARVNRRGEAVLRVTCKGDPCKGELRLSTKKRKHGKQQQVGRAQFSIAEGEKRKLLIRLTKAGRKALASAKRKRLPVRARALLGPLARPTAVASRRIELIGYAKSGRRR